LAPTGFRDPKKQATANEPIGVETVPPRRQVAEGFTQGTTRLDKLRQIDRREGFMTENRTISLRCRCGHVHGAATIAAQNAGFRFICYCRDCQGFARFLERPDVLDSAGGTDIFHMPAGRVKLGAGTDAVRSVQYSGKVFRWYAYCCKTPIANTAGPGFPVVGLIHAFMDHASDGRSRDEVLGAPLCRIFEQSATAFLPADAPPPRSFKLMAVRVPTLLGWWWRGLGRPSPFFDASTGAPIAEPRVLARS
jgi:Family of unknown function (DUF6151)